MATPFTSSPEKVTGSGNVNFCVSPGIMAELMAFAGAAAWLSSRWLKQPFDACRKQEHAF